MSKVKLHPIVWKKNDTGYGETAYCNGQMIGWVRRSLAKANKFYPSILNDMVKFKADDVTTMKDAREMIEKAFNEIVIKFIVQCD